MVLAEQEVLGLLENFPNTEHLRCVRCAGDANTTLVHGRYGGMMVGLKVSNFFTNNISNINSLLSFNERRVRYSQKTLVGILEDASANFLV